MNDLLIQEILELLKILSEEEKGYILGFVKGYTLLKAEACSEPQSSC